MNIKPSPKFSPGWHRRRALLCLLMGLVGIILSVWVYRSGAHLDLNGFWYYARNWAVAGAMASIPYFAIVSVLQARTQFRLANERIR